MYTSAVTIPNAENFISRWQKSGASERANYQLFLSELCDLLGVEKPRPATDKTHEATYCFERPVKLNDGEGKTTTNFIDLYKQDCFVLEAKQGADKAVITEADMLGASKVKSKTGTATRETRNWEREMKKAREQALRYARALPVEAGWPPFLVVVDVGYCIDLYADFARQGKTYLPFPNPLTYRIKLTDLSDEQTRERLRILFTDPLALDPGRRAARVTRELAARLAKLASLLETAGHTPEAVAGYLMRCLFTMFAEDVGLLPEHSFIRLLKAYKDKPGLLPQALQALWTSMDRGGFDAGLHTLIPQFNGFLFKEKEALPLSEAGLDLLIEAAKADWADVEPAIFGTLLERALQPRERHKLGAHYTPRAYVERLVMPTVIEPLREEWDAARAASAQLEAQGNEAGALQVIENFHRRLCSVRVLDPACGSGNFLYVTLEHFKRLEGEVAEYMRHFPRQLGLDMTGGYTVTPAQFLGLEVNPRAAAIADVVLWIGYLQWHFRVRGHGRRLEDPILRKYGNIKQQDAVLNYSEKKPRLDTNGQPVTRWDGHTTKKHPITGLEVPDETARTPVYDYLNPKQATWPKADFIVGNPPFVGNKKMRIALGDGYTEALRLAYKGAVPDSVDFVMYWWYKAAEILSSGNAKRLGFITTNSITQPSNREIIHAALQDVPGIALTYAIADHPWVDSGEGADVRIAMTVAAPAKDKIVGTLSKLTYESRSDNSTEIAVLSDQQGQINANLTIGVNLSTSTPLKSNEGVAFWGVKLYGKGFIISEQQAERMEATSSIEIIKPLISGRDLAQKFRNLKVIDCDEMEEGEVRNKYPEAYQHLLMHVKPERDQNPREKRKQKWWLYGENQPAMRKAIKSLKQYTATAEVLKHRVFQLYNANILPEGKICVFAFDDPYFLGVLSSRIHTIWAASVGGRLGVGNDLVYVKSKCFDLYPFPVAAEQQIQQIREIAEQLDSHRKERQALFVELTITDMYNVLEKLGAGETLNPKEQKVHEQGLVSILLQLHNELDAAVAEAYGWSTNLSEEEILEKLVALNKERAAEEANGLVRWLRPEYQNPGGVQQSVRTIDRKEDKNAKEQRQVSEWPDTLAEQAQAVQRMLHRYTHPVSGVDIYKGFKPAGKAKTARLQQIDSLLETFSTLGLLRKTDEGQYVK